MRDYKHLVDSRESAKRQPHRMHGAAIAGALIVTLGLVGVTPEDAAAIRSEDTQVPRSARAEGSLFSIPVTRALLLPKMDAASSATTSQPSGPIEALSSSSFVIRLGDTLSSIFRRADLPRSELVNVMQLGPLTTHLQELRPGETIRLHVNDGQQLVELIYEISPVRTLHIERSVNRLNASLIEKPVEKRIAFASGTITDSLYSAAQAEGLTENLTMQIAAIFGWDIDFGLDIRNGDQFAVIYEEHYLDGRKLRDGAILAAEFLNRKRRFQAVQYTDASGRSGFFDPDGRSMRKTFLRTPVDFRRISSRFQRSRWHPVLGKKRPHRGVDYAAKTGTPVKATGDGKVAFIGRKGGYGKTIVLQHGQGFQTLYAHMNKFKRGLRDGARVSQGDIIGYVGQTGVTTGPHLHYEFRVNGVHRNPLTLKFPSTAPISRPEIAGFRQLAAPLITQLGVLRRTQIAMH